MGTDTAGNIVYNSVVGSIVTGLRKNRAAWFCSR